MTFLRAIATTASILALTAAAAAAPASSNAYQIIGSDNEIHDLSTFELFSALNERGINAEHAEAWGQAIRVDAIDETGRSYLLILDKNTSSPSATMRPGFLPCRPQRSVAFSGLRQPMVHPIPWLPKVKAAAAPRLATTNR